MDNMEYMISEEDKKAIYILLRKKFALHKQYHMAEICLAMTNAGYTKERYGYNKMKLMLKEFNSFMLLEDTEINAIPAVLISLKPVQEWEPFVEEEAVTKLPDTINKGNTFFSPKIIGRFKDYLEDVQLSDDELIHIVCKSYDKARRNDDITENNGSYGFELDTGSFIGKELMASITLSGIDGKLPWALNYVGLNNEKPGKALEKFAYLGPWKLFLQQLKDKALPEIWDFKGSKSNYTILKNYIQYTFYHLKLEDKICISDDFKLAAFNTGLVDDHYEDIYACFVPNDDRYEIKWRFECFCTATSKGMGKQLVNKFNPLPQPASYFSRKEDLLFDLEKELIPATEHIIYDNISRLPVEFLRQQLYDCPPAVEILDSIEKEKNYARKIALYDPLLEMLEENSRLHNRINYRIKEAIDLARKKVRWNYKTALPCYFPTRNVMSLMLPLALVDDSRADVALVVELTPSGNYQGQTILTLQQAYIDSRLICRPNSEWLNTDDIVSNDYEVFNFD